MTLKGELIAAQSKDEQLSDTAKQLQIRIRKSVKNLRESYYKFHHVQPIDRGRAFGGKVTESIGAFAEYNLRTSHCPRSLAGLCTPCFYSKFPDTLDVKRNGQLYNRFILEQIDDIIDKFDDTVVKRQTGKVYYRRDTLTYKTKKPVAFCITPVGSFFNENELPTDIRKYLLNRLNEMCEIMQTDIILYVESHVLDFNRYLNEYADEQELFLLQKLHTRIVFGFESHDKFVRDVLYGKDLALCDFENAVSRVKAAGLGAYAFTFVGLFPMSHNEMIRDAEQTFQYLRALDVTPVVMFANIQEYTIADLLLKTSRYKLVNPLTVLEIIKSMLSTFGTVREDGFDAWLIADPIGGPPEPAYHIFSDELTSCCANSIYRLIKELRNDHEYNGFHDIYNQVSNCMTHKKSLVEIYRQEANCLEERTEQMLDYIEKASAHYLTTLRSKELIMAKAHLLCEGAAIDSTTKKELRRIGITDGFIHSTNLLLDGYPVNACLLETLSKNPLCAITFRDNCFFLSFQPNEADAQPELVGKIDFIRIPEWGNAVVDGLRVSDYLRPHSKSCITIWPNQRCAFGLSQCKFCSLPRDGICLKPTTVAKMVETALQYNPGYDVHLSGGVYGSLAENVDYYSSISNAIHEKYPSVKISLEAIPTINKAGMEIYKNSGIASILMNLELANESIRKLYCPGKSTISRARYFEAFSEAVELFGRGNVGSVLLYGIDGITDDEILSCARKMCEIGVYPVIMPFQPLLASSMKNHKPTSPEGYLRISEEVWRIIKSMSIVRNICTFGCINCCACSIENNFSVLK